MGINFSVFFLYIQKGNRRQNNFIGFVTQLFKNHNCLVKRGALIAAAATTTTTTGTTTTTTTKTTTTTTSVCLKRVVECAELVIVTQKMFFIILVLGDVLGDESREF